MEEKKTKKEKKFLQQPEYPGGRKALREFIAAHLQYPEDAMNQRIEGAVTVAYQVNDEGEIKNPKIIKGLSPSCNEEAIRLVKLLQYGKAHNHGIRVKSNCKIYIHFHLAPQPAKATLQINYSTTPNKPTKPKKQTTESYSYSLVIKK